MESKDDIEAKNATAAIGRVIVEGKTPINYLYSLRVQGRFVYSNTPEEFSNGS